MSGISDVTFDVLVASGEELPPSGQIGGERWRIAFPPSAETTDLNNGGQDVTMLRRSSAVLTLTCTQSDPAYKKARRLHARQSGGEQLKGGQAFLTLSQETVRWGTYTITQQADLVSASSAQTVSFEFALQGVTLTPGA